MDTVFQMAKLPKMVAPTQSQPDIDIEYRDILGILMVGIDKSGTCRSRKVTDFKKLEAATQKLHKALRDFKLSWRTTREAMTPGQLRHALERYYREARTLKTTSSEEEWLKLAARKYEGCSKILKGSDGSLRAIYAPPKNTFPKAKSAKLLRVMKNLRPLWEALTVTDSLHMFGDSRHRLLSLEPISAATVEDRQFFLDFAATWLDCSIIMKREGRKSGPHPSTMKAHKDIRDCFLRIDKQCPGQGDKLVAREVRKKLNLNLTLKSILRIVRSCKKRRRPRR